MRQILIPRPDRLRRISGSFGWVDHRLLRDGHLARLGPVEAALYLFLVLAADRQGISYYRLESIGQRLGRLSWHDVRQARERLVARGLIAFAPHSEHDPNGVYQVLPLDGLAPQDSGDGR
jgi:hypothetical protein